MIVGSAQALVLRRELDPLVTRRIMDGWRSRHPDPNGVECSAPVCCS